MTSTRVARAGKLVVFLSNLIAIWLLSRLVSRGIPPIFIPTVAAFLISGAAAFVFGDIAVSVVLALIYAFPAIAAGWFNSFLYSYNAIWLAALCGAMLPRTLKSGWAFPPRWRAPLVLWACALALSWPIVVARELDFNWALLDKGGLWNSRLTVSPPAVVVWVTSVTAIAITGLLLMDWLFDAYDPENRSRFESRVIAPLIAAAGVAAVVGVYQTAVDITFLNRTLFGTIGRAVGTLRDGNAFGMIAALWSPIAAALAVRAMRTHRPTAALCAVTAVLLAIGVWGSGSRTALMAVLVGFAIVSVSVLRVIGLRQLVLTAVSAVAIVGAVAVLAPSATKGPFKRMGNLVPGYSKVELQWTLTQLWDRDLYGVAAARMIHDHPFVGIGVGGFNYQYADTLYVISNSIRPPDNAQNWYKNELAELGLLGSAGWIFFFTMFVTTVLIRRGPVDQREVRGGVKGAIVALGLGSMLGMPTQDTAASITFIVLIAWCLKLSGADLTAATTVRWKRVAQFGALASTLIAFLAGTAYAARTTLRPVNRAVAADFPYRYGFDAHDRDPDQFWAEAKAVDLFQPGDRWLRLVLGEVAPDAEQKPVDVKVWRNDELILRLQRRSNFPVERWIRMPDHDKRVRIEIQVGRTWQPVAAPPGEEPPERGIAVRKWEFAYWPPPGAVTVE